MSLGIALFLFSSQAFASTNLLVNPGAESDGTGWTSISNGGDGMSYNFDNLVRSGTQSFQTSFGLDSIYQKVDLFANGYSTSSMDSSPAISFSVWFATRGDQGGQYYVKFALLQQDGTTVVTSTNFGDSGSLISVGAGTDWTEIAHTCSGYGAGVRYVYIEFGGQDQSFWAGNYGTHFDDASIVASPVSSAVTGGGNAMPWWGYLPPKGPFSLALHGGGSTTDATQVLLDISASSDVDRMAISRYEDFRATGIIPFSPSIAWSLCGAPFCEAGTYDVYAKFYQSYGVTSPVQHLVITYVPAGSKSFDLQETSTTSAATSLLRTIPASTPESIVPLFTRNLRQGERGPDVKQLQIFLNTHGHLLAKNGVGSPGEETDVFGPALKRALVHFQETHANEILKPFGLKKGTGIFAGQTRSFVNTQLNTKK